MNFYDLDPEDFEVCRDGELTRLVVLGGNSELGVIKRKAGKETGALINPHPGSEQFIYMLEGKARIQIGEESKVVEAEQLAYVPFDTPHSITPLTDLRYVTFYAPIRPKSLMDKKNGRKAVFTGGKACPQ